MPDASDNCPTVPNPYQMATDDDTATCRFIDNNDGTVTDMTTGKMWERVANSEDDVWWVAVGPTGHCQTSTLGGYTDWGLPTRAEFQDLIDPSQRNPALPSGHPFVVFWYFYWTSEEFEPYLTAWAMLLYNGHDDAEDQDEVYYVWCVRN